MNNITYNILSLICHYSIFLLILIESIANLWHFGQINYNKIEKNLELVIQRKKKSSMSNTESTQTTNNDNGNGDKSKNSLENNNTNNYRSNRRQVQNSDESKENNKESKENNNNNNGNDNDNDIVIKTAIGGRPISPIGSTNSETNTSEHRWEARDKLATLRGAKLPNIDERKMESGHSNQSTQSDGLQLFADFGNKESNSSAAKTISVTATQTQGHGHDSPTTTGRTSFSPRSTLHRMPSGIFSSEMNNSERYWGLIILDSMRMSSHENIINPEQSINETDEKGRATNKFGRAKVPRVDPNKGAIKDLTQQYIDNKNHSSNNTTDLSPQAIIDLKLPAASTVLQGNITSMTNGGQQFKGSQSTMSLDSHKTSNTLNSQISDISASLMATISNNNSEPVSLIIYELDHVLATMLHKIDEIQQMYENNPNFEIDNAEYLTTYSIESLIQKRQEEQKQGKQVSNSVEIDLKNPFLLMFGGLDRVVQLKKHLSGMLSSSMLKQQENILDSMEKTSSVGSLSNHSSNSKSSKGRQKSNGKRGVSGGLGRKRKSKSKSDTKQSRFGKRFSRNRKSKHQIKNPKCFIFCQHRPTLFVVMLLKQIGINDMFVTVGNNQIQNQETGEIEIERVELSHVIGSDHLLMKQNENKTHLIILKLIRHFGREHDSVLYIGHDKDTIRNIKNVDFCHTYQVDTKGMLDKDMIRVQKKFLG